MDRRDLAVRIAATVFCPSRGFRRTAHAYIGASAILQLTPERKGSFETCPYKILLQTQRDRRQQVRKVTKFQTLRFLG